MAFGYVAGSVIAVLARGPLARTHDAMRTRYFAVSALYGALALAPVGVVLYALFPDWSVMYLVDPSRFPSGLMMPLLFLAYAASPPIGFLVSHRLLPRERRVALRVSLLLPIAAMLLIGIVGRRRLLTVTYYEAYFAELRERLSIFDSQLLPMLLACAISAGAAFVSSIAIVRRHVDRVETVATGDGPGEGSLRREGSIEREAAQVPEERSASAK